MIDTEEYYGGTYPDPPEDKEDKQENYDDYMADVIQDEMMLKEIREDVRHR